MPRVAIRGVRSGLLMTHVDNADILIDTTIVDIDDMAATKREYGIDTFAF